jgi:hypothetical protein
MEGDPEIAEARVLAVNTDSPSSGSPKAASFLRQLLDANPKNRMAFEYLMGQYLLEGDSANVTQNIGVFDPARELPQLIDEAAADYELHSQKVIPEVDRRLRKDTHKRLIEFREAISAFRSNLEAGRAPMAFAFGKTYWYFKAFGTTGCIAPPLH